MHAVSGLLRHAVTRSRCHALLGTRTGTQGMQLREAELEATAAKHREEAASKLRALRRQKEEAEEAAEKVRGTRGSQGLGTRVQKKHRPQTPTHTCSPACSVSYRNSQERVSLKSLVVASNQRCEMLDRELAATRAALDRERASAAARCGACMWATAGRSSLKAVGSWVRSTCECQPCLLCGPVVVVGTARIYVGAYACIHVGAPKLTCASGCSPHSPFRSQAGGDAGRARVRDNCP